MLHFEACRPRALPLTAKSLCAPVRAAHYGPPLYSRTSSDAANYLPSAEASQSRMVRERSLIDAGLDPIRLPHNHGALASRFVLKHMSELSNIGLAWFLFVVGSAVHIALIAA